MALSVGFPRPAVSGHLAWWCPDFPPSRSEKIEPGRRPPVLLANFDGTAPTDLVPLSTPPVQARVWLFRRSSAEYGLDPISMHDHPVHERSDSGMKLAGFGSVECAKRVLKSEVPALVGAVYLGHVPYRL